MCMTLYRNPTSLSRCWHISLYNVAYAPDQDIRDRGETVYPPPSPAPEIYAPEVIKAKQAYNRAAFAKKRNAFERNGFEAKRAEAEAEAERETLASRDAFDRKRNGEPLKRFTKREHAAEHAKFFAGATVKQKAEVRSVARDRASPNAMGLTSLGLEIGIFCNFLYTGVAFTY